MVPVGAPGPRGPDDAAAGAGDRGGSGDGIAGVGPGGPARLIGRPSWRWFEVRRWGARRVGVASVVVVYAALGSLNALSVPPLVPRDETGHVSYVVSVAQGRLPTIHSPLPKADVPLLRSNHKDTIWVANHPPLFYVLGAVPMKVALSVHRPVLGIRLIRLMNVCLVMATMILAAVLARRLVRRSNRAPIVAAATTGLIATVPHTAAMAYNDALAMCTAAALVVAAVAVFDRGASVRSLAWVAGTASAAALTRFTNLAVIAAAGVVVAIGVMRHTNGGSSRKARAVLRAAAIVGVPVAVTSGWFYLRNRRLYGDFTGAHDLLVMFHRKSHGSARTFLTSSRFWRSVHDELWTRYSQARSSATYGHGWPLELGRALTVVLLAGLVCALGRWIWLRRTLSPSLRWAPELTLALLAVAEMALFGVMMAQFASGGGSAHSRYLFPLLPVIACSTALAWASLPGNRRGILSAATLVAAIALAGDLLHRLLVSLGGDDGWIGTEINALAKAAPGAAAVLMGELLVLGIATGVASWVLVVLPREQLLRRPPRTTPAAGNGGGGEPVRADRPVGPDEIVLVFDEG